MRILVADDDPVLQALAAAILEPQGYEVLPALDGLEAFALFQREHPDIVLADYSMPGMDGLELCGRIREAAGERFIPVVVFTGAAYPDLLRRSLEAGAMEFLTKPFEPDELLVRVKAIARLADLHNSLVREQAQDREEVALLKHVLGRLLEPGHGAMPPTFHMETLRTHRISGDACAYSLGLPGIHFGMICDATGHGLVAGVSTIPVVEAFLSMVTKDIPLEQIYREIGRKLDRMMPTGRFACLLLFRMDTNQGSLTVLNAGMPEAHLLRRNGQTRSFPSRNLPAGVALPHAGEGVAEQVAIETGDRFLAFSDGLVEAIGLQDIQNHLLIHPQHLSHRGHQALIQHHLGFRAGDADRLDDISWALWEVPPAEWTPVPARTQGGEEHLADGLQVSMRMAPRLHEPRDLVPPILSLLTSQRVDQGTAQILALLLGEALSNALDHGLLGLDSGVKASQGFEAYERLRQERLGALAEGSLTLHLTLLEFPETGRVRGVRVEVEDSGVGFDWRTWLSRETQLDDRPHGRGLALLRAFATDLAFNEAGNAVRFTLACP